MAPLETLKFNKHFQRVAKYIYIYIYTYLNIQAPVVWRRCYFECFCCLFVLSGETGSHRSQACLKHKCVQGWSYISDPPICISQVLELLGGHGITPNLCSTGGSTRNFPHVKWTLYHLSYKLSFSPNNKLAEKEIRKNKSHSQQLPKREKKRQAQPHSASSRWQEAFLMAWHQITTFTSA